MSFSSPVIRGASNILFHVPDLVRYGSKPYREIEKYRKEKNKSGESPLKIIKKHLRNYNHFIEYGPNQSFIGCFDPDRLNDLPKPWFKQLVGNGHEGSKFGEMIFEEEFYILLKAADDYDLIWISDKFLEESKGQLPYLKEIEKIKSGIKTIQEIRKELKRRSYWALPIFSGNKLIGCFRRAPDEHASEDDNLGPHLMMEDLIIKASGAYALNHLLKQLKMAPNEIDYIISCSEEAVGDRYNRGGGSMAKAIAEVCGCENATGPDVKAFCAGPIYAAIIAASLVKADVCKNVAVVGGGCLAKIGMKYQGHVAENMPILEDALASIAFLVTRNDFESPVIRLDAIGKCSIKNGASQQAVMESLIVNPLKKIGLKLCDIDKYAVELHNPEITVPSKTGDVPRKNYEMIAALAIRNGEITRADFENFIKKHGMPGFSPTQGHIPAGIPFLGYAIEKIKKSEIKTAMFVARGSLFLGRMSHLYDGASFVLEPNGGIGKYSPDNFHDGDTYYE